MVKLTMPKIARTKFVVEFTIAHLTQYFQLQTVKVVVELWRDFALRGSLFVAQVIVIVAYVVRLLLLSHI